MPQLHSHPRPLQLEQFFGLIGKLLSPVPFGLAALFVVKRVHDQLGRRPSYQEVRTAYPWLIRVGAVVAFRVVNRVLTRLAENHGWARDRPVWSREIVVVTGGVGGIGSEIVKMLLRGMPGVRIAVFDLAEPTNRQTLDNLKYYKVDITSAESVAAAGAQVRADFGDPTMVVNNAGIMRCKDAIELTSKEFETTLKVNVLGAFNVTKEFLPSIAKKNHGHIVTVASTAAFYTAPSMTDYSASKAGAVALMEGIAADLSMRFSAPKVRTTTINPVKVRTNLGAMVADHKQTITTPVQEPWQVAERIVLALDSGLSGGTIFLPSYMYATLPLVRVLPEWFRWYVTVSSGTADFATKATRSRGEASGYKILSD